MTSPVTERAAREAELTRLLAAAEAVRATRYGRCSRWCGGSERVADGVDARLLASWLAECAGLARRACGPASPVAARLASWLEAEPSIEVLEAAVADLRSVVEAQC